MYYTKTVDGIGAVWPAAAAAVGAAGKGCKGIVIPDPPPPPVLLLSPHPSLHALLLPPAPLSRTSVVVVVAVAGLINIQ